MTVMNDNTRSIDLSTGIRRGTVKMQGVWVNTGGIHASASGMAVVELDPLEQITGFLYQGTLWGNGYSHMSGFLVHETR